MTEYPDDQPWIAYLTEFFTVGVEHEEDYGAPVSGEARFTTEAAALDYAIAWTLNTQTHLRGSLANLRKRKRAAAKRKN